MTTLIRIIVRLIAAIVLLCALAIVGLVLWVNPNDFKSQISDAVYRWTGRPLLINGSIQWSLFPWLGLQLNQIQINNPLGFSAHPFMRMQRLDLRIRLLPLLHHQLEIAQLNLIKPEIFLEKNQTGQSNWQGILERSKAIKKGNTNQISKPTTGISALLQAFGFTLAGLMIESGHLVFIDPKTEYEVNAIQLYASHVTLDKPMHLKLSFQVRDNKKTTAAATIQLATDILFNARQQTILLPQLKITTSLYDAQKSQYALIIHSNARIDGQFTSGIWRINSDHHIRHIDARSLWPYLTDMTLLQLAGDTTLDLQLNSQGANYQQLMTGLNGQGTIEIDKGILVGIDINYWIDVVQSWLKRRSVQKIDSKQTVFNSLHGNFSIVQGKFINQMLLIHAKNLYVQGKGQFNWTQRSVDYKLMIHPLQNKNFVIPLKIYGPLHALRIRPELNALIQQQATSDMLQTFQHFLRLQSTSVIKI